MAAAGSDPPPITLVLTDAESGELVSRAWRVSVIEGVDRGASIARDGGTIVVGTHQDADLPLGDPSVSRYHAELRLLPEGVLVVDLGSRNGTRVGGARIERILLPPRGTVRVGKTVLEVSPEDRALDLGGEVDRFGEFVTRSAAVRRVIAQLRIVAGTDATVLIEGETGTGKELLAHAIHEGSARRERPFVVVDMSTVTGTLLESQLFGHQKGAFTGAVEARAGAFEAAEGGTVFLDELGELPIDLQPKLLRVLEARTVRRLGDVDDRPVDVRFVAATNRPLEAMVDRGEFRRDLFFRIAVVRARVAPLSRRPEDVPLLAALYAERFSSGRVSLTEGALRVLAGYDWPGNARELRNVIERAVALTPGSTLGATDLFLGDEGGGGSASGADAGSFKEAKDRVVAEFERRYVAGLLARHEGNVSSAAREAGMSRNALYSLMKRTGLG